MYKINIKDSNKSVTAGLAELREYDKKQALVCRKVYDNLKCKDFGYIDEADILVEYNGPLSENDSLVAIRILEEFLTFDEVDEPEEIDVEDIEIEEINTDKPYEDMTVEELIKVLTNQLGTETELSIERMSTGLHIKQELLYELKQELLAINNEESEEDKLSDEYLTNTIAIALALVKKHYKNSLSINPVSGDLWIYDYLHSEEVVDYKNYVFMSGINDPKPDLELSVLEATAKTFNTECVTNPDLDFMPREFNIVVSKKIQGITEPTEDRKTARRAKLRRR